MSEYDDHETERRKDAQPEVESAPEARVKVARWSPWMWIIPAIAIFFVGYLIVRYGFFGGGDITVRFAEARGLDRYSPVRFRGAKVGTVQKISIDENLGQVVVRISMDASMNHALRQGTKFWIVEPGLEGGGIGSILSGTYVGIAPAPEGKGGEETREFVGQEYAPVVFAPEAGKTVVLERETSAGLSMGTPVTYRGIRVGQILGTEYDAKSGRTKAYAFIVKRFANQVRESTRFWHGGGLNLSLSGGGVSMGGTGLSSLLSAPVSFYTPEVLAGAEVADGTRFDLHASEAAAVASADGPHLTYMTYFQGSIGGLRPGTPVHMKGVQVGRVRDVRLRFIPQSASLETPVTIEIDPRQMQFPIDATGSRVQLRGEFNEALGSMVQKGMRAGLATSLVLPGASAITLDFVARPNTARLITTSDPPIIPTSEGEDGLAGAMRSINELAGRIRNLPLEEIAGNMRNASRRINQIVSDPVLDESLRKLDRSLTEIERAAVITRENVGPIAQSLRNAATSAESAARTADRVIGDVGENVDPIVESLRNAASSAEAAASRAEQLMGTSARQNYDLGELIKELTRAAEAVRALAAYLAENPDALLKGRAK